jgi:hypothetical protein
MLEDVKYIEMVLRELNAFEDDKVRPCWERIKTALSEQTVSTKRDNPKCQQHISRFIPIELCPTCGEILSDIPKLLASLHPISQKCEERI